MIDNTKKSRSHTAKKIIQLNNLINCIEKSHKEEEEKKITSLFEKYKTSK